MFKRPWKRKCWFSHVIIDLIRVLNFITSEFGEEAEKFSYQEWIAFATCSTALERLIMSPLSRCWTLESWVCLQITRRNLQQIKFGPRSTYEIYVSIFSFIGKYQGWGWTTSNDGNCCSVSLWYLTLFNYELFDVFFPE